MLATFMILFLELIIGSVAFLIQCCVKLTIIMKLMRTFKVNRLVCIFILVSTLIVLNKAIFLLQLHDIWAIYSMLCVLLASGLIYLIHCILLSYVYDNITNKSAKYVKNNYKKGEEVK